MRERRFGGGTADIEDEAKAELLASWRRWGRGAPAPKLGRFRHGLGADADQPDGARAGHAGMARRAPP